MDKIEQIRSIVEATKRNKDLKKGQNDLILEKIDEQRQETSSLEIELTRIKLATDSLRYSIRVVNDQTAMITDNFNCHVAAIKALEQNVASTKMNLTLAQREHVLDLHLSITEKIKILNPLLFDTPSGEEHTDSESQQHNEQEHEVMHSDGLTPVAEQEAQTDLEQHKIDE